MTKSARAAAFHALMYLHKNGLLPPREPLQDPRDQRFYTTLVKGVLRTLRILDEHLAQHSTRPLDRIHPRVFCILRLASYELLFLETPMYAGVDEGVELASQFTSEAKDYVNAVLRRISEVGKIKLPENPTLEQALPDELAAAWKEALGPLRSRRAAASLQIDAPLAVRTNFMKTTREKLVEEFQKTGAVVEVSTMTPEGLTVRKNPPLSQFPPFMRGEFYVQNEASQLVSHLVAPSPGELILDACAAPGGKSTHLAELSKYEARILSADRSPDGVERIHDNIARLKTRNVDVLQADILGTPCKVKGPFDKVLIDAPCSAWGILREHPEWRWTKSSLAPGKQANLQLEILSRASDMTRPGGALIFSVCTFSAEETTKLIYRLLSNRQDLALLDPRPFLPEGARSLANEHFVQTFPGDGDLDGFFMARLSRK